MKTLEHALQPEEIMALIDGELLDAEAQRVADHLDRCVACKELADRFRSTSRRMSDWNVPSLLTSTDAWSLLAKVAGVPVRKDYRRVSFMPRLWGWTLWATGGGVVMAVLFVIIAPRPSGFYTRKHAMVSQQGATGTLHDKATMLAGLVAPPPAKAPSDAPMIAKTIGLTVVVKDFSNTRSLLDSVLLRHQGFTAQLTALTQENAPRSLQASLRIPVADLGSALSDIRALGRVEKESQSGEEVTQEHADLVARLRTAHETEDRFHAILVQRTGNVADVLKVEEEIARVQGEIERMEAEQRALEHRVDFATIDLELLEEYKARLESTEPPISLQMKNAFVAGCRNAVDSLVWILLGVEEYGPALVIWLCLLGVPVVLLWRRYRLIRGRL